ncbi:hypothetical protein GGTG_09172 [Gaeumannomyces tritici R3-111a-1]|uniref:Uncharacterized protein n=1 Tax=Gaeumannomyces tritici (strain R3-111a-1) TaxID=644352 RepID=J3P6N0_GAET3|nr:hypothetical protein GGTG_09172 [Gaeumannomyces tritici R3-111a-1]EJT72306.1 hypothetical protein GGTG_09172 [Gaeumannomyces tritici R3-111a-1]
MVKIVNKRKFNGGQKKNVISNGAFWKALKARDTHWNGGKIAGFAKYLSPELIEILLIAYKVKSSNVFLLTLCVCADCCLKSFIINFVNVNVHKLIPHVIARHLHGFFNFDFDFDPNFNQRIYCIKRLYCAKSKCAEIFKLLRKLAGVFATVMLKARAKPPGKKREALNARAKPPGKKGKRGR